MTVCPSVVSIDVSWLVACVCDRAGGVIQSAAAMSSSGVFSSPRSAMPDSASPLQLRCSSSPESQWVSGRSLSQFYDLSHRHIKVKQKAKSSAILEEFTIRHNTLQIKFLETAFSSKYFFNVQISQSVIYY